MTFANYAPLMKYIQSSGAHIIMLIIFMSLLYLPCLGTPGISRTAELRYAEVAKETFEDGHWVIPYFNGEVYYHKPPLFFCTVALLSKATGTVTEVTARLPSVLGAFGTVLVTYFLGKSLFGSRAGLMAALILACTPKFHHYARAVRLDVMYTFFITSALASFYYGYMYKQRTYLFLSGAMIALAALTKGPLILYFPAATIFFYLAYCHDLRFLVSRDCLLGVVVLLLTVLAWAIPAYMEGGSNYINGFIPNNITKYATKSAEWDAPLEYLGDVFIGAAPWAFLFPLVLYNYFSNRRGHKGTTFLLIWVSVTFLSFCLTFERKSTYLLPIYPALSITIASYFDMHLGGRKTMTQLEMFSAAVYSLAIGVGLLTGKIANSPAIGLHYVIITTLMCITLLATVAFLSIHSKSLYALFVSSLISLSVCAFSQNVYFIPKISEELSPKALCKEIRGLINDDAPLGIYKEPKLRYAFRFYADINTDSFATEGSLARFLDSSERAYCLMRLTDYRFLRKHNLSSPAKELTSNKKRYVLVFKQ